MKKIIKLTESDLEKIVKKVLRENSLINEIASDAQDLGGTQDDVNTEINSFNQNATIDQVENMKAIQRKLKELKYNLGTFGPNKDGVDGRYGNLTLQAIKDFQGKNGIKRTGWVGSVTAPLLGVEPMKGVSFVGKRKETGKPVPQKGKVDQTKVKTKPEIEKPKSTGNCIAISKEECNKVSSTKETTISKGSETRCSAYMVKCLSQYDSDLFAGNAWDAFNNVKNGGSVKYNAYTDGSVNWPFIYSELKKNKIGKSICSQYASKDHADEVIKGPLPKIVTNSIPPSSKININSLKLGDIVGLYHSGSHNKGMAFCQRAMKRNLDDNGNLDKDPFTFNSHVGFVGAIKNGIPIIIHNVEGIHTATPATQMLSKNSRDMIVWVVSDNSIASAIENRNSPNVEKKGFNWW